MENNLINYLHKCNFSTIDKVIKSDDYVMVIDVLMRHTNQDITNKAIICYSMIVTNIEFFNGGTIFVHGKLGSKETYIILTDLYTTKHLRIYKKSNLTYLTKVMDEF